MAILRIHWIFIDGSLTIWVSFDTGLPASYLPRRGVAVEVKDEYIYLIGGSSTFGLIGKQDTVVAINMDTGVVTTLTCHMS